MVMGMKKDEITVVICCAGMGTRLGIGSTKALIDIYGKPLIVRLLELLDGYDDIRIVVGFQAEKVIEVVNNIRKDILFVFNHEYDSTGVAKSLQLGLKCCRKYIVEIDGDIIINPKDFDYFMNYPNECIAITEINSDDPILVDINNNLVCSFSKYKGNAEWTGLFKLEATKLDGNREYIYELIEPLLPIDAIEVGARDIDTAEDYDKALIWYEECYKEGEEHG